MLKDRGTIKWAAALFLPPKKLMLKKDEKEQERKIPIKLDAQTSEEFNKTIFDAMKFNSELYFFYYNDGDYHILIGYIHYLDQINGKIKIIDKFDQLFNLKTTDIIDIRFN